MIIGPQGQNSKLFIELFSWRNIKTFELKKTA